MNSVLCPHCGKKVEISQALRHELEEQIKESVEKKHSEELEKLKEESEKELEKKLQEQLLKNKAELEEKVRKKVLEEHEFKLKDAQNALEEYKERTKQQQEQLLEMNKLIRDLKEQNEKIQLETQKRMNDELEKMRNNIIKTEKEKSHMEKLELEKKLEDMKRDLENAQRKAHQSSQQLQGEVLELDLETQLRSNFTTDEIAPVPKGVEGADIMQIVKNKFGQSAGKILWETKRTKAWSNTWTGKLREDMRHVGASAAVLVSDVLPAGIKTFDLYENVWITCYEYAIPLANVLRIGVLQVAVAKSAATHKDEKLETLYQYVTSETFRHRFEALVESMSEMQTDLEKEKRSMAAHWKKREMHIRVLAGNTANMYGELKGLMGAALPSIDGLELSDGVEDNTLKLADGQKKNTQDPLI